MVFLGESTVLESNELDPPNRNSEPITFCCIFNNVTNFELVNSNDTVNLNALYDELERKKQKTESPTKMAFLIMGLADAVPKSNFF